MMPITRKDRLFPTPGKFNMFRSNEAHDPNLYTFERFDLIIGTAHDFLKFGVLCKELFQDFMGLYGDRNFVKFSDLGKNIVIFSRTLSVLVKIGPYFDTIVKSGMAQ